MSDRPHALGLTVRAWIRYLAPFTLLSALALAPIAYVAMKTGGAKDLAGARSQVRLGWTLAGTAWIFQLWLVAGVAPAVQALARGQSRSQLRALGAGVANMVRGLVPCAIAAIAIVLGGMALVVPGAILLVLLAPTGASPRLGEPPPAPLAETIEAVRANARPIAIAVGAIVAIDLAIALASQLALVPTITKKVAPSKLLPVRTYVRVVGVALVVFSPLAACALAAVRPRADRR